MGKDPGRSGEGVRKDRVSGEQQKLKKKSKN